MNFDLSREWLETNGIGGFASGTVINCNTRRYHAVFCPATQPPLGRVVLVNKIDETIGWKSDGENAVERHFDLGANQYPGAISPNGYQWLVEYTQDPLPGWIYTVAADALGENQRDIVLEKTLWMPHEKNITVLRYRVLSEHNLTLSAHPFVTGRDYHGIHRANEVFNPHCAVSSPASTCRVQMQPYEGLPSLNFDFNGDFHAAGSWYYDFEYAIERERGLDWQEDAWCPGALTWHLSPEKDALLALSCDDEAVDWDSLPSTRETEIGRRRSLQKLGEYVKDSDRDAVRKLALGADQFIVRRGSAGGSGLHTILAGYPWFSDWGRDTMIALPGLCLTTNRSGEALSILLAFAGAVSQGMIPNRFPDAGEIPDYNTIDATLWFFHAVGQYFEANDQDCTAMQVLYPTLKECLEAHWAGTRYGIRADEADGLLMGGDYRTQLTWMDAKVGDVAFTPRAGKAVEIQALWFNALKVAAQLATVLDDKPFAAKCNAWSRKVKANFAAQFWNESAGCLYDYIDDQYKNPQIRPNQIFVLSLSQRLLSTEMEKRVLNTVQNHLLTPYGLRSLSPHDSDYRGIYIGGQWQRDSSYHQGTVWGWLLGPFLCAYLRLNRNSKRAQIQAREWLEPMLQHLDAAGLNSISEIFDGDAPHTPRGTPAQAWSVAETLRVLVEELN